MKRILKFLYDTWYGMAICWCVSGAATLVLLFLAVDGHSVARYTRYAFLSHFLVMTPLAISAPVVSGFRRKWRLFGLQMAAGGASLGLFFVGFMFVSACAMFSDS